MQTTKVQVWQVDPGDDLLIGGESFHVTDADDQTEAITLYGIWEDDSVTKEIDRHPYDEIDLIVSWDED